MDILAEILMGLFGALWIFLGIFTIHSLIYFWKTAPKIYKIRAIFQSLVELIMGGIAILVVVI